MIELRPYQNKFVSEIRVSLAKYKKIIACAATGSGKSKVFISISRAAIAKGKTVLIISESRKIYSQIHEEIGDSYNIGDGVKEFYVKPNSIFVAMAQTLARREGLIKQFQDLGADLIIINDEAHIGTATKLLLNFPDAYLIGFTASPFYKNAKHLPDLYNEIVVGPQPQELIELGFLSPYKHFERQVADLSKLKKSGGDFTEASQELVFGSLQVFEGVLDDLYNFDYKKCMIFCASINHCEDVASKLLILGFKVSRVHSKNPNSDFELFNFTSGGNNICVSVGSLTKGFDYPPIDLVILNRATTSAALYLQMCGRGSRIAPDKNLFTVLDYGRNGSRFKLWTYEHDFAELWKYKPKKEGAAPLKSCPECGFMMAANAGECPECGFVFEEDLKAKGKPPETELIELTDAFNKLRGFKISTLTPRELVTYAKTTGKKEFAKRIAKSKGDPFLSDYGTLSGWKHGWKHFIKHEPDLQFNDITIK